MRNKWTIFLLFFSSFLIFKLDSRPKSKRTFKRDILSNDHSASSATLDTPLDVVVTENSQANPMQHYVNNSIEKIKEIEKRRKRIQTQLKFFGTDWLRAHIPELGGKPIRNIIVSTWRSGSSFMGEIFASHPGTIYLFEPFMKYGNMQVRNSTRAKHMIKSLLNCNFDFEEYLDKGGMYMGAILSRSPNIERKICKDVNGACVDPTFISDLCRLHPIQLIKFVRLRLKDAEELLQDKTFDTRILYLIRDPRGTMKSRFGSREWCKSHPDCSNETHLCLDLEEDYASSNYLKTKYPGKFRIIRYEDFSQNVVPFVRSILSFFRLSFHPSVKNYLKEHTTKAEGDQFATYRKTKDVTFNWVKFYLDGRTVILNNIQGVCLNALSLWGYKVIPFEKEIKFWSMSEVVLDTPPWKHMMLT